jgi:hypothetical protein
MGFRDALSVGESDQHEVITFPLFLLNRLTKGPSSKN